MKLKMWLLTLIICLVLGVFGLHNYGGIKASQTVNEDNTKLQIVSQKGWSIYDQPFSSRSRAVLNTNRVHGQLVKLIQETSHNGQEYYLIKHDDRTYGWVNSRCLSTPRQYVLPYQYYSQLYPLWAPEACEATSLKIGLSAKGLANDVGLKYIVDHMPKSSHSNRGFSGDPYHKNSGIFYWWNLIRHGFNGIFSQTIYPKPLAKYARKYDSDAKDITGSSKLNLINDIKHGKPIVFVGSFQMIDTNSSYHILTLVGYKPGYFLVADPYRYLGQRHGVFWVKTSRFMKIFDNQLRGRRAISL